MTTLRIAAAQSLSAAGDVHANVAAHVRIVAAARELQVALLVFPELSLSGYELPLLKQCALQLGDARLDPLRACAREAQMTLVVGAPVPTLSGQDVCIGSITLGADGTSSVYRKQYLGSTEPPYAVPGEVRSDLHALGAEALALAIRSDAPRPRHAAAAREAGASLYAASVLWDDAEYAAVAPKAQGYAAEHALAVLVANHGGPSGQFVSAGKSAFWAPGGQQLAVAPAGGTYLLVARKDAGSWSARSVAVPGATP